MNDTSVMIDLETLSQKKTAAIVSIGATKFDGSGIIDEFYINIDPLSCKAHGLHIQKETIDWWKKQKPEAYDALKNNRNSLEDALAKFSEWFGPKSLPTWACSNSFDCVILENAYDSIGESTPWKFYDERCFRTFKAMFKSNIVRKGVHHNSLDDAIYQAEYMIDVLKK